MCDLRMSLVGRATRLDEIDRLNIQRREAGLGRALMQFANVASRAAIGENLYWIERRKVA